MKFARFVFSLILCATGSVAFTQQPPASPDKEVKDAQKKVAAAEQAVAKAQQAVATTPTMTHEESLELENLQLKFSIAQTQQQSLQSQYQAFVQGLNAEHPGFTFNVQTGQFVAVPKPAEKK